MEESGPIHLQCLLARTRKGKWHILKIGTVSQHDHPHGLKGRDLIKLL